MSWIIEDEFGNHCFPKIKFHPRKCCITDEGMNAGYLIGEGLMYIKYESDMIKHLRDVEKEGNTDYDELVAEGRLTDEYLLNDYYESDYYYYTDWECSDDIQFVEIDGVMYDENVVEEVMEYVNEENEELGMFLINTLEG